MQYVYHFGLSHRALIVACCIAWSFPLFGQRLKLVFAGDIMMHDSQLRSAQQESGGYDFSSSFQHVAPILQEADLAIGNLELTLPGRKPYTGYPNFRSPDTLASTLKDAGFDVLVTANNHSNDSGRRGILHTLDALHQRDIRYTGTFADSLERDTTYPLIIEQKGFRLALLNYTYGTNNPHIPPPCVVNLVDTAQIKHDLERARGQHADLIIVYMHWGSEYHLDESESQRRLTWQLFHWGADLIVGAHPHVVQPVKLLHEYRDGQIRRGLVAYSLGNFISGQIRTNTDLGLLLEVEWERHPLTGVIGLRQHQYIPVWRHRGYTEAGQRTYTVLPVSAFAKNENAGLSSADRRTMLTVTSRIRKHLRRFHSSERVVSLPAWKNEKIR